MGIITDDLTDLVEQYEEVQIAVEYRKRFKKLYFWIRDLNHELDAVIAGEKFTELPQSIKSALNKNRTLTVSYIDLVESDSDIMELLFPTAEAIAEP